MECFEPLKTVKTKFAKGLYCWRSMHRVLRILSCFESSTESQWYAYYHGRPDFNSMTSSAMGVSWEERGDIVEIQEMDDLAIFLDFNKNEDWISIEICWLKQDLLDGSERLLDHVESRVMPIFLAELMVEEGATHPVTIDGYTAPVAGQLSKISIEMLAQQTNKILARAHCLN